jgi:hypothetical protein
MKVTQGTETQFTLPRFDRQFFDGTEEMTIIGGGDLGGKASGLVLAREILRKIGDADFPEFVVNVPRMVVISTEVFDIFMRQNHLYDIAYSDESDERIGQAFQKASFPPLFVGDLRALVAKVHQPLAVRSSSLLEDAMYQPFAGVYATKMTPNNQMDVETRFSKLVQAVKYVWASTFFKEAKTYIKSTNAKIEDEKMAVIIQEVVGARHGERFYPHISGVARSYNFYPMGRAKPEQGVVDLALGLGKTIVDGGRCWTFSPAFPKVAPPFASARASLKLTQSQFWAINMGPVEYDPLRETEYMVQGNLDTAERDETLPNLVSTYDGAADRLVPGLNIPGPRVITFAPVLDYEVLPLNTLLKKILATCEDSLGVPVETEFAITLDPTRSMQARFGFLQVRPMVVSNESVTISNELMDSERAFVTSTTVLGNGTTEGICDIVFVKPEVFEARHAPIIAQEIERINRQMLDNGTPYLLIGFGRWGSSDPWLGIPVVWSQISAARAIVEATLPEMNVDLSQGSHFFHNLSSYRISYFSVRHDGQNLIRWDWLERQPEILSTNFLRHVRTNHPLTILVDGRNGKGIILHD